MANSRKKSKVNGAVIALIAGICILAGVLVSIFVSRALNTSSLIGDQSFAAALATYFDKNASAVSEEDLATVQYLYFASSSTVRFGGEDAVTKFAESMTGDGSEDGSTAVGLQKEVEDLSAILALFPNLKFFGAESSEMIASFEDLKSLSGLEYLNVYDCDLTALDGVDSLSGLKMLNIGKTKIRDLSALKSLTSLELLTLSGDTDADLSTLSLAPSVKTLRASGLGLEDLSSLPAITTLEELTVSDNKLTSLKGVEKLTGLKTIDFTQNKVTDLSPLTGLTNLATVTAASNGMTDPEAITSLSFPEDQNVTIALSGNEFTDWEAIHTFDHATENITVTGYPEGIEEEEPEPATTEDPEPSTSEPSTGEKSTEEKSTVEPATSEVSTAEKTTAEANTAS